MKWPFSSKSSEPTVIKAEIVATGDELLRGMLVDSNSAFVSKRLSAGGIEVTRVTKIGDDVAGLAPQIASAMTRAQLVVTIGGLGPTTDDRTVEALGYAAARPLEHDPDAEMLIAMRYRAAFEEGQTTSTEMSAPRLKMARLPAGGIALPNPVGPAPGVLLETPTCLVVCLPGPPGQLEPMWDTVHEVLVEKFGLMAGFAQQSVTTTILDESLLAEELSSIAQRHPGAYIKSHARTDGLPIEITVMSGAETQEEADAQVDLIAGELSAAFEL